MTWPKVMSQEKPDDIVCIVGTYLQFKYHKS